MANVADPDFFSELSLFRGLPPDELAQLNALLHHQVLPAGANLMTAGQPGKVVYVILAGTVKIHVEQADGHDVIIAILGAGEIVGEMSPIDDTCRSASVITLERSTLLWAVVDGSHRRTARAC